MKRPFGHQDVELDASDGGADRSPTDSCPECGSDRIVVDDSHGEMVCRECSCVVMAEQIDTGPEWTAFDQQERQRKSRVGAPISQSLHDRGLTTTIHWQDEDVNGNPLSSEKRNRFRRLRTWHERIRTKDAGERNLKLALAEINRMGSALEIPRSVREVAAVVYRRAMDRDLIQGRSIEAVATGTLYIACRQEDIPRSLDEFAEVSRVRRIEIGRAYRQIAAELDLELQPIDPHRFLPRFCSQLELGSDVRERASDILDAVDEAGLFSGKSPTGLAGAAIYHASLLADEDLTQSDVANVAQVTEVTIRNRYHDQKPLRDEFD